MRIVKEERGDCFFENADRRILIGRIEKTNKWTGGGWSVIWRTTLLLTVGPLQVLEFEDGEEAATTLLCQLGECLQTMRNCAYLTRTEILMEEQK